jgi:hypothetical protein
MFRAGIRSWSHALPEAENDEKRNSPIIKRVKIINNLFFRLTLRVEPKCEYRFKWVLVIGWITYILNLMGRKTISRARNIFTPTKWI